MKDILLIGDRKDCRNIEIEILSLYDFAMRQVDCDDGDLTVKQIGRFVKNSDVLIVDVDFITPVTAIAIAYATEYNIEIVGYFCSEEHLIGRFDKACDTVYHIDRLKEYFEQ